MQVIPLKYGTIFKKSFSQPDVFCQFVEDILDIKFKSNLPKKYKEKLEAMTLEQLEIVSEKIITSDTLEEIFN